jgi:hypothetical protein
MKIFKKGHFMKRYVLIVLLGLTIAITGCAALDAITAPGGSTQVLDSVITSAGGALAVPTGGLSVGIAAVLIGGLGLVRRIRGLTRVIREIDSNEKVPPVEKQLTTNATKNLAAKVLSSTVSKGPVS